MPPVGDMPWGAHFSLAYETPADLVAAVVPYFAAGLKAGELCVWLPSTLDMERAALKAFRKSVPRFDHYLETGAIEVIQGCEWGLVGDQFSGRVMLENWKAKYDLALRAGYSGLRGSGDHAWIVAVADWHAFTEFEARLHRCSQRWQALLLCTYPLSKLRATELLDVVRGHNFAIARRHGDWEAVETPTLRRTKEQIQQAKEDLEQRVHEQASQLVRTKQAARERELQARFEATLEERNRLARELHDSLLQSVTGMGLQLRAALPHLGSASPEARASINRVADLADATVRDARHAVWDMRQQSLVEKSLPSALEDLVERARTTLDSRVRVVGKPRNLPPVVADTVYRIAQEALHNAVKHAHARVVRISLEYRVRSVRLVVADDGCGFRAESAVRSHSGKWGLVGMRERAERVGATLSVRSTPGHGTSVELRLPTTRLSMAEANEEIAAIPSATRSASDEPA